MIHNLHSAYSLPANHDTSENYKRRKHERNPKTNKGDDNPGSLVLTNFLAERKDSEEEILTPPICKLTDKP